jgi:hypothetical protein
MGISFRLFNEEHTFTWQQLSNALGFDEDCLQAWSKDRSMENFSRAVFWKKISSNGLDPPPLIKLIDNPTLNFVPESCPAW